MNWLARDYATLWHPFTAADEWERQAENLAIERGEGVWLIDTEGNHYLDGTASLWCNVLGHRHPRIDASIRAQLDRIAHSTMLGLTHPGAIQHAERLCALTGLDRVFYSDSGSTAVEVALKMAFQAKQQQGEARRTRFVSLTEAYHGDTVGSVSLGGIELFHGLYRPLLFEALRLPAPERADGNEEDACLDAARRCFAAHGTEIAALIVEPLVQGAAGMRMHRPEFLRELVGIARAAGAFVIADEVATGFGRTGTMFACEAAGVKPDFMCLAKAITGGYLPLAATLATEEVYDAFRGPYADYRTFFHGHTYTGNPLAIAAANATLDAYEAENVLAVANTNAVVLGTALRGLTHSCIREVRHLGMMGGVVLRRPGGAAFAASERVGHRVSLAARRHGAIVRNLGDTVMVMPPLVMEAAELGLLVGAIEAAIHDVLGAGGAGTAVG
ncbi:adenosylmethionine-8-amino-7-oxononanoate aminotransferase [Deltaproteobacteria bacterium]|nr:adenosylmethionine-8-amino-7-oxononanoate aminotransferase [Deltaproteobacteria bacterium]